MRAAIQLRSNSRRDCRSYGCPVDNWFELNNKLRDNFVALWHTGCMKCTQKASAGSERTTKLYRKRPESTSDQEKVSPAKPDSKRLNDKTISSAFLTSAANKPSHHAKRIAILNHKGGVGKSTTAINLAGVCAEAGARVLVVDCDPQGNLSSLLSPGHEQRRYCVAHLFTDVGIAAGHVVVPSQFTNIDVMPCDHRLNEVDLTHGFERDDRVYAIADAITELESEYDIVILDCSPRRHLSGYAAVVAADKVLVPTEASVFSLSGLPSVKAELSSVKQRFNPWVQVRFFLSRVKRRGRSGEQCRQAMVEQLGEENVLEAMIPDFETYATSINAGKPVTLHAPNSKAAYSIRRLAAEVLGDGNENKQDRHGQQTA